MFVNFFKLSLQSLKHRKLRSWLTILGVIIGVTLVVTMVSLGQGMKTAVLAQMKMFGTDLIFLWPGEESNPFLGFLGGEEFKDREVAIVKKIKGVDFVLPFATKAVTAEFKGEKKLITLAGSPWTETRTIFEKSRGLTIEKGDWPKRDNDNEAIIGSLVSNARFKNKISVGDFIVLKGKRIRVSGIFAPTGDPGDDSMIYLSLEKFREVTDKKEGILQMIVKVKSGYNPNLVAADIKYELGKERKAKKFAVLTMEKTMSVVSDILGIIELILGGIAVVALLVGGVGIMNTMYTAILERTREIGVMKAVGAQNFQIMILFLIESGMVGLVGGFLGLCLGVVIAKTAEFVALGYGFKFLKIEISLAMIFLVLVFTFLFGSLAGLLPARRAAYLNPVQALRK